jgi:hypothetical protein
LEHRWSLRPLSSKHEVVSQQAARSFGNTLANETALMIGSPAIIAVAHGQDVGYNPATGKDKTVESRCGAVAVGSVCLLPPLSSGGARLPSP